MATIRDVCRRALMRLRIVPAGQDIPAGDAADALDAYNQMVLAWKARGTDVTIPAGETESTGAYVPKVLGDDFDLGDHHIDGVIALLAVRLSADYGKEPGADTRIAADHGWTALQAEFNQVQDLVMDDGLLIPPQGSSLTW